MENGRRSVADFTTWIQTVCKQFASLTDFEKNQTLDYLISSSGSEQLKHLSNILPQLLYRDFITFLPPEVTYHILKYLDGNCLLTCCLVSKAWHSIIITCTKVWWQKAVQSGATDVVFYPGAARKYRKLYLKIERLLLHCSEGHNLEQSILKGHEDRVMTVFYKSGKIATGSDDHSVRIWDSHSGNHLQRISTHTVCDLRMTDKYLYTASFDGSAACWELTTGQVRHRFVGHTSAVFSLDVAEAEGFVVTGSSDKTVRLWTMGGGSPPLLTTLENYHSEWVTKVKFLSVSIEESDVMQIASVDKYMCIVWKVNHQGHILNLQTVPGGTCGQITSFHNPKPDEFFLSLWNDKELTNYLCSFSLLGKRVTKKLSMSLGSDIPLKSQVQGIGQKFAVLTGSSEINKLFIFNIKLQRCVARIQLPYCRSTRNGTAMTLGNCNWLDGFDGSMPSGVVFIACLHNCNEVFTLNWKQ